MFGPQAVQTVGQISIIHTPLVPVVEGLAISAWDARGRVWKRARGSTLRNEEKLAKDVARKLDGPVSPRAG